MTPTSSTGNSVNMLFIQNKRSEYVVGHERSKRAV